MKRKFTKRKIRMRRPLSTKSSLAIFNPWALLLVIVIIGIFGFTIFFYTKPNSLTIFKTTYTKFSLWIEKHKHHSNVINEDNSLVSSLSETKKVAKEQQIQFEFYSILPSMQVTLTENTDNREINDHRVLASDDRLPFSVGNQEELEREISAHIQTSLKKSKKRE